MGSPDEGYVKINCDGAIFEEGLFGGIGVIIKDHDGLFLAAKAMRFDQVADVLQIEAQAALAGLDLAKLLGYKNIVLECDSSVLVDLIINPSSHWNPVGTVVQDIIAALCSDFNLCSVQTIGRDGNIVAHSVIRDILNEGDEIWLVDPPLSILSSLHDDISV